MDVTASFNEGAILTLVLPLALLIAVTIWWVVVLRRHSSDDT
jgi:hypothetical protein